MVSLPTLLAASAGTIPLLQAEEFPWVIIVVVILGLLLLGAFIFISKFIGLWFQAYMSNAQVSLLEIIGMYFRKVDAKVVVINKVALVQAGLTDVTTRALEAHFLAKGNVPAVARAYIAADRADLELKFTEACGIDLAGRNVFDAVATSVNPRVIDCPNPASGKSTVDAVAADGIQLKVKARVTVRANLKRLIGGATEETIIARVGEGIVSAIGSARSHKEVLENPDRISKAVLGRGLDAGTAFEILSIDIADVDVGENIGAKLQADQAEADMRVAQAAAEKRAAIARAAEQEMQALTQENRAKVVLAEAEIPKAIAQAFREGNLGLHDYYKLRNIQADTEMRTSISKGQEESS